MNADWSRVRIVAGQKWLHGLMLAAQVIRSHSRPPFRYLLVVRDLGSALVPSQMKEASESIHFLYRYT